MCVRHPVPTWGIQFFPRCQVDFSTDGLVEIEIQVTKQLALLCQGGVSHLIHDTDVQAMR